VDRPAHRRNALAAALGLLILFALWTAAVRLSVAEGSRWTAWAPAEFGQWPPQFETVGRWSDTRLSIYVSFALEGGGDDSTGGGSLGHPTVGSHGDYSDSGFINGTRFETGVTAGRVFAISAYVLAPIDVAPHNQFALAIYRDEYGSPGALLAATEAGTLSAPGWNTLPIEATLQPGTAYWLMYTTNGSNAYVNNLTYTPVTSGALDYLVRRPRSDWPTAFAFAGVWLGNLLPATLAMLGLLAFLARTSPRGSTALLAAFLAGLAITYVLKTTLLPGYDGYPSGHVLRATFVAVALAEVARGLAARFAGALLVTLVAFGVIHQGGHNFEEVLGSILLASALLLAARAIAPPPPATPVPDPA
jgi:hypothetical protein